MLKKLNRTSLADQAYMEMETMIASGKWLLGSRIPSETELMEQLGVSRNTLREAVRAMVHVGLLETRQGDGTFVMATSELGAILQKRIQRSTALEILEVRHALDRQAVQLACLNRTDSDMSLVKQLQQDCLLAYRDQDLAKFVKADWQLHQAIAASSHNALLTDIYADLFAEIQMSIAGTTEFGSDSKAGHLALVQAIADQDAERAAGEVDAYIALYKDMVCNSDN